MHTQSKGQLSTEVINVDWHGFLPALPLGDGDQTRDLTETRMALQQAELALRVQENRIRFLETMVMTDELTGLTNRRGFAAAFERELALARRNADDNGILIMIDLDGFKLINDKYGHQAGDAYLRAVSQALQETVRASDTVARLGGDEFAILLGRITEKNGVKCLAKMERAFNSRFLVWNGKRIPMRASFGFAPYDGTCAIEDVLHMADIRLYACKARIKTLTASIAAQ